MTSTLKTLIEPATRLPRLLYIGDVPVESSQHGSTLLFRMLSGYPSDRLMIVETALLSSPPRRLRATPYLGIQLASPRLLNSRLHALYSAWSTQAAPAQAGRVIAALGEFRPEAILTVGHGFGWLTAAAVSRRLRIPLHFAVHDDWPRLSAITKGLRGWLDRRFGAVYRDASTRLCVSPFMAEEYERRYGVVGQVLMPSRSADCVAFPPRSAQPLAADAELVIGYGGNGGPEILSCLRVLARALAGVRARVEVYGPFTEAAQDELRSLAPVFRFNGLVPFAEMIAGLRDRADVLYVPMTFDAVHRANQSAGFPSKLADYTATGLPLLVHGPPYASAVRWARLHAGVAEVVDEPGPELLRSALVRLHADTDHRNRLATRAVEVGSRCFDAAVVKQQFRLAIGMPQ